MTTLDHLIAWVDGQHGSLPIPARAALIARMYTLFNEDPAFWGDMGWTAVYKAVALVFGDPHTEEGGDTPK